MLSEHISANGKPLTVEGVGATKELAYLDARQKIPSHAEILNQQEIYTPDRKVITLTAHDEQEAEKSAGWQARLTLGGDVTVERIRLITSGGKGFLG